MYGSKVSVNQNNQNYFKFANLPGIIAENYFYDQLSIFKNSGGNLFEFDNEATIESLLEKDDSQLIKDLEVQYDCMMKFHKYVPTTELLFCPVPLHKLLRSGYNEGLRNVKHYHLQNVPADPFARIAFVQINPRIKRGYILCEIRNVKQEMDRQPNESFMIYSFSVVESDFTIGGKMSYQLETHQTHQRANVEKGKQSPYDLSYQTVIKADNSFHDSLDEYDLSFLTEHSSLNKSDRKSKEVQMFANLFASRLENSRDSYQVYIEDFKNTDAWKNRASDPKNCMTILRDIYRTGKVLGYNDKTKRPKFAKTLFKGVKINKDNSFAQGTWNEFFLKQIAFLKK